MVVPAFIVTDDINAIKKLNNSDMGSDCAYFSEPEDDKHKDAIPETQI
jgi:hypothetical protein